MPRCHLTRLLDLGEPIEVEIAVDYTYTSHSTGDTYFQPGDPCEIEIDDVECREIFCLGLLGHEEEIVNQHAADNESTYRADEEQAYWESRADEDRYARQFDD